MKIVFSRENLTFVVLFLKINFSLICFKITVSQERNVRFQILRWKNNHLGDSKESILIFGDNWSLSMCWDTCQKTMVFRDTHKTNFCKTSNSTTHQWLYFIFCCCQQGINRKQFIQKMWLIKYIEWVTCQPWSKMIFRYGCKEDTYNYDI